MTAEMLIMKGLLSELDPEHRAKVEEIAKGIRSLVESDKDCGPIALALIGLEMQEKA